MAEQVVGRRFVLSAQTGKGGMGSVFRARDLITSRTVAVKVLELDRPYDLARFKREADLLGTVRHPNVVAYVAHGESNGLHYLAQEWIEGTTFATLLHKTGATAQETVRVGIGLARALEAIHKLGVVHRDVKPSNLILQNDDPDQVKLVDFGIARRVAQTSMLTTTGSVVGTPGYMSPEQARGLTNIDGAADIWGLGCVLYEGLTGRPAFAGTTPMAIRAKVLMAEPPPIATFAPEVPAELAALVHQFLSKDPTARPTNVADKLAAFADIAPGPRRLVGAPEPATAVIGASKTAVEECISYVFIASNNDTGLPAELAELAARHSLDVHAFEDGSAMLASRRSGKAGAVDASAAALALEEVFDGSVAVFARPVPDDPAFDRGGVLLDKAQLTAVFGDDDDTAPVLIDQVVADLVAEELPVVVTEQGAALKRRRS